MAEDVDPKYKSVGNLSIHDGMLSLMLEVRILPRGWCHASINDDVSFLGLPLTNSHNARSARLRFHIPQAGVLHGLAGYFEAVLYGNVGLSIHPHRKSQVSKDMLSWFPLFFPFKVSDAELHTPRC
jgi:PRMT5 oligomerisation domain